MTAVGPAKADAGQDVPAILIASTLESERSGGCRQADELPFEIVLPHSRQGTKPQAANRRAADVPAATMQAVLDCERPASPDEALSAVVGLTAAVEQDGPAWDVAREQAKTQTP